MRIMALDVGSKTIGVAVTDEMGWTAQGVTIIRRRNEEFDFGEVGKLLVEYNVEKLVIGLPLRAEGEIGIQAKKILKFKEALEKKFPDMPMETWDESMTTHEAHEIFGKIGLTSKKRKKSVDKLAAAFILESYLRGNE